MKKIVCWLLAAAALTGSAGVYAQPPSNDPKTDMAKRQQKALREGRNPPGGFVYKGGLYDKVNKKVNEAREQHNKEKAGNSSSGSSSSGSSSSGSSSSTTKK